MKVKKLKKSVKEIFQEVDSTSGATISPFMTRSSCLLHAPWLTVPLCEAVDYVDAFMYFCYLQDKSSQVIFGGRS